MQTAEEERVLAFLRQRRVATVADVARACLPGASAEWAGRVLANLDWFGLVVLYEGGEAGLVQITDKGRGNAGRGSMAAGR